MTELNTKKEYKDEGIKCQKKVGQSKQKVSNELCNMDELERLVYQVKRVQNVVVL